MPPFYTDSKGRTEDAETMVWVKLDNTVKKMEREGRTDGDYEALKAVRDRRHEAYLQEHPELRDA